MVQATVQYHQNDTTRMWSAIIQTPFHYYFVSGITKSECMRRVDIYRRHLGR